MGELDTSKDARRSSRTSVSIPVEVYCRAGDGREIRVRTNTKLVNKHGASFTSKHRFPIDSEVILSIPKFQKQQQCRVAWVSQEADDKGNYEVAVELENPENYFGIQFPPDDWHISTPLPLVGTRSGSSIQQSEMDEFELQRLSTVTSRQIQMDNEKIDTEKKIENLSPPFF